MTKKNYETSSGNIFADLELPNPEQCLAKANLAIEINALIKQKGLTQKKAATLLGIDQPKISALSTGRLTGFSLDRLFRFLNKLDQNIDIKITAQANKKEKPHISVSITTTKRIPTRNDPTSSRHVMQARKKK